MIRIDTTETVAVDLAGEQISIRTLTARQRMRFAGLQEQAAAIVESKAPGWIERYAELEYEALSLVLEEDPDTLDPRCWGDIVRAALRVNQLAEDDAGNSPSP